MDLSSSTPFDLAILARSDCIVHPHKTKLLCHCTSNNSGNKNKNPKNSSNSNSHRTRSPEVFAIVSTGSSSSNNEGFSSNSSNASFGTSSPIPMSSSTGLVQVVQHHPEGPPPMIPTRNMRAQSVTQVSSTHSRFSTAVLQKSASELSVVKQLGQRHQHHHHQEQNEEPWLRVVPSYKVRPRNCDEVPEEFKRAGIGLCFGGKL